MYFVQDNGTNVSYDNSTVQAVLEEWKCTDELSCICCKTCNVGQPPPPGGRRKRSAQDDGPPDEPKPLTCTSTPIVCPPAGSPGSPAGPPGPKGRRKKRSPQNPLSPPDGGVLSNSPLQPPDGGLSGAPQLPDGGGQPGEIGIIPDNAPAPEADPDFKTNAEFLKLLMQLDEKTRERIGHK